MKSKQLCTFFANLRMLQRNCKDQIPCEKAVRKESVCNLTAFPCFEKGHLATEGLDLGPCFSACS